ncbi:MAG: IclR family transcriptional regulator [Deltaproteobacteria bacterium]|jgi:DNA-binding IclR family transcriptional regulator|nr:IclR family transcriptional regulator [Deltaproteobacteria bacterium]
MSIQSVSRALSILKLFSAAKTHLGITEIGKTLNLSNPTVHGLVRTMLIEGFLTQDTETKKYCLGIRNYELGHYFLGSSQVYQVGAAATHRLAQTLGLNARLAVRDGDSVVVILLVYSQPERFQYFQLGPKVPNYCTSLGKAILAWLSPDELADYLERTQLTPHTPGTITDHKRLMEDLEQSRMRGYSTDRQELVPGLVCAAAPIFDQNGQPIASLSISADPNLLGRDNISELTDELIQTSNEISYSLGYHRNIIAM